MSEVISYRLTNNKKILSKHSICARHSQHKFIIIIIAMAYLNIKENLKSVWPGHISKSVSQLRQNLLIKALETGSIFFQTLSTNMGEMRKNACKLVRYYLQPLDISDTETENDVLNTDKYQWICDC